MIIIIMMMMMMMMIDCTLIFNLHQVSRIEVGIRSRRSA
jgi:hypothetical protein